MAPRAVCLSQHGPLCHADVLVPQNFDEAPLAAATASGLLGYALHTFGDVFFPFFSADSLKLGQLGWRPTVETFSYFWSLQRCLMGLSQDSGWGHSGTSLESSLSFFCVVLVVWLRSCLKVKTGGWELRPTRSVWVPSGQTVVFVTVWVLWVEQELETFFTASLSSIIWSLTAYKVGMKFDFNMLLSGGFSCFPMSSGRKVIWSYIIPTC